MHPVRQWFLLCLLAGLVGCGSLGLTPPQTWQQRIAYVNGSLTAVYDSITSCVQSLACSKETGRSLIDQADTARGALDIARAAPSGQTITMCFGKAQTAVACLEAAKAVTDGLHAYLKEQK